jgi:ELWxxDGT repeat protein
MRTTFNSGNRPIRRRGIVRGSTNAAQFLESRLLLAADFDLFTDINTQLNEAGSQPQDFTVVGSTMYFTGSDDVHGRELWKTDGTVSGTAMVKDIRVGSYHSAVGDMLDFNGTLYFRASDGVNGIELWKTDGTESGTVVVKDIVPGSVGSTPVHLVNVDGTMFFEANFLPSSTELWKSDGTEAGTVLVKTLNANAYGPYLDNLVNVNGTLFFGATDVTNGVELWKSDGTDAGTVQVKDINPGANNSSSPRTLTNVSGTLYFSADDGTSGREFWKSDGTSAGTVLVKDIRTGTSSSFPASFTNVGGTIFLAANEGTNGSELWKTDGTAAGTVLVKDIQAGSAGSSPSRLTNVNGTLYLRAYEPTGGVELWKSDGTSAGTLRVKDINPGNLSASPVNLLNLNGTLYFQANDASYGRELWKSDGSDVGTVRVADINAGAEHSNASGMANFNGTLLFQANDGSTGPELWRSNGTAAGTSLVRDLLGGTGDSDAAEFVTVSDIQFFRANDGTTGLELWKSDGTAAGTMLVKDIRAGTVSGTPLELTNVGGVLYFTVDDGLTGRELWKSDGTAAGTVIVRDIRPGSLTSSPTKLTNVDGTLYFRANDGSVGSELWRSDGTSAGTTLVRDIFSGSGSSGPDKLTDVSGTLFFSATHPTTGTELWKSDGTTAGTVLVRDLKFGLYAFSANPKQLTNVNGTLFFSALEDGAGRELWRSDGSFAGTTLVKDIAPGSGPSSYPFDLVNGNGTLFFTADDTNANRRELWKSDGTTAGTVMVKDIAAGNASSYPTSLTWADGTLFLVANDNVSGSELWKSDGTEAGTVIVRDLKPGSQGALPTLLTFANSSLYFAADEGAFGVELWRTDGTSAGTEVAKTLDGSRGYHEPQAITALANRVFFTANEINVGLALFEVYTSADYGDAIGQTASADNGARHQPYGAMLGTVRDVESDATPTTDALGDDSFGVDDEDGVSLQEFVRGQSGNATVTVSNADSQAFIDAWFDFNQDGDWDDAQEQVLQNQSVLNGVFSFDLGVPATALAGDTFARFRISNTGNLAPVGQALTGEVEDYLVTIRTDESISIPSGNGADSFAIRRNGANIEVENIGTAGITSYPLATLNSLTIVGVDNEDDTLSVDLSTGGVFEFPGGLTFASGTSGNDHLQVVAPSTARGVWTSVSATPGAGGINVSDSGVSMLITFSGLESADVGDVQTLEFSGDLPVGANQIAVTSATPIRAASITTLAGGTLTSSVELALGAGDSIIGNGQIDAPIAAEAGSLISATGSLSLGQTSTPIGFFTRGRLATNTQSVTLNDSNQAVLGSLTTLGSGSTPGTINAANGLLIDFGNNVTGTGTLNTPNDVTKLLMLNGAIVGNSASEQITLPGYIKGVGSLDNVNITGTYSPGFSPAISYSGSITYGAGSTTIMEIGGTTPGSAGHDQIVHSGTATLGGILDIQLINAFTPSEGDSFVLMTATTVVGTFDTINLPTLSGGLSWDINTTGDSVTASVVSNAPTDPPGITGPSAVTQAIRPTITWNAVSGATEYEIWVKNQSTGVNPFHNVTVSGTSYTPTVDFGIGKFNLWIRGKNSSGFGPWTPQYNFTVNARATMNDPGRFLSTHTPNLTWPALPGAVKYDLWIDDKLGGVSQYIRDQNVTGTSWTPSADMPLGLYQAWIRGIAADGTGGGWSVETRFYVMPSPTVTAGMNPTFDRTPTFEWDALLGAVKYEVFIRDRNTGLTTLYQQNIAALDYTVPTDLADGPYRVWMIGVSAANVRSFWTNPMDIYIGGRTDVLTPAGSTSDTTPTFTWRAVDGAVRYDLWVDQIGGTSQIIREQNLTSTSFTPSIALAAGNYRVWVRAISTTGETADWSITVEFTITSADEPSDSFSPETLLTSQALSSRVLSPLPRRGGEGQGEGARAAVVEGTGPTVVEEPESATRKPPTATASGSNPHLLDATFAWWAERPIQAT